MAFLAGVRGVCLAAAGFPIDAVRLFIYLFFLFVVTVTLTVTVAVDLFFNNL